MTYAGFAIIRGESGARIAVVPLLAITRGSKVNTRRHHAAVIKLTGTRLGAIARTSSVDAFLVSIVELLSLGTGALAGDLIVSAIDPSYTGIFHIGHPRHARFSRTGVGHAIVAFNLAGRSAVLSFIVVGIAA